MSGTGVNLQKSIYQVLSGDSNLLTQISGVFDFVPETQVFPWVMIGDDTFKDWNTNAQDGKMGSIQIHVWSRKQGRSECKTIQNRIKELLNETILTVTGAIIVLFQLEFETTLVDPDGVTLHGVQRFRTLIQEG